MNSANKAFLNVSMFIVSLDNVAGTVGLMLLIRKLCFTGPRAVRWFFIAEWNGQKSFASRCSIVAKHVHMCWFVHCQNLIIITIIIISNDWLTTSLFSVQASPSCQTLTCWMTSPRWLQDTSECSDTISSASQEQGWCGIMYGLPSAGDGGKPGGAAAPPPPAPGRRMLTHASAPAGPAAAMPRAAPKANAGGQMNSDQVLIHSSVTYCNIWSSSFMS